MLTITMRDLQWRARRIVVGACAAMLVFAVTLLLQSVHDSFLDETDRTIAFFGGDSWVVTQGLAGPFTTNSPMKAAVAQQLAGPSGAVTATPVAIFRHVVEGAQAQGLSDVNVIAYRPDGVVTPRPTAGRPPRADGEVAVDDSMGVPIGATLTLAGVRLTVVGTVAGLTYTGGTPTVVMTLSQGQSIAYDGEDMASAIVMQGSPAVLPAELAVMTPREVRDDLRRPLQVATRTLGLLSLLLWLVAGSIVAFVCYLSALDRLRDVAVLKAVGAASWRLCATPLIESLVVSLGAAVGAIVLTWGLIPTFPLAISLGLSACLVLALIAVGLGVIASLAGIARVLRIDPALALAGA
jgi:putative ABC transport system permease protein